MSRTRSTRLILAYLIVLAALALLGIHPAHATIYVALDARRLAQRSDAIMVGNVGATYTRWQGGRIVTEAVVAVQSVVKGKPPRTVRVLQPGGKVGGIAMRVLGAAEFHVGDRAILFLARTGDVFHVVGLEQGKLNIERTPTGLELVHFIPAGRTTLQTMPIDQALDHLRSVIREP